MHKHVHICLCEINLNKKQLNEKDEKLCTHIFYCPHIQCFTKKLHVHQFKCTLYN